MKVWIDVDNAPHAQIFRPIIARLNERGAETVVTARDRTFVPQLLTAAGIRHTVIGRGQPAGAPAKAASLAGRSLALAAFGRGKEFHVAVGHGSRSLPPAARLLRVPNLTMYDYEHVSSWLFRTFCDRVLIPRAVMERANGSLEPGPWRAYDGFKEEIYLTGFTPDPDIRGRVGANEEQVLIVVRPPSATAHYHDRRSESTLDALASRIAADRDVRAVWLRRDPDERVPASARADNIFVPDAPLDGLSLLASADLAISGGGTMNREAALLGTPAYSIFTGPEGVVDRSLIDSGRLTTVRTPQSVGEIRFVKKSSQGRRVFDGRLRDFVVDQIMELGTRPPRPSHGGGN